MNAHLQQQLSLSDSDLCSIPYTLSRSELGLLLVELHQAARLQQSGHRYHSRPWSAGLFPTDFQILLQQGKTQS